MNTGSGLRTFALVAVIVSVLSVVRLEVEGGGGGDFQPTAAAPGDFGALDGDLDEAEAGTASEGQVVRRRRVGGGPTGDTGGGGPDQGPGGPGGPVAGTGEEGPVTPQGIECAAGRNGGETAPGVTESEIKVASTAALDGEAKSLLASSVTSMQAVFDKVNQQGGICGRRISLRVDNDKFEAPRGQQIIRNYAESGDVFALPVVPSAEGLGAAIEGGVIREFGLPVVGTDGMRREQYRDAWVWPVATSTTSMMRIMAKRGAEKGAETFAIVYDSKYKFGIEGKDAFVAQVKAQGGKVVEQRPLDPEGKTYNNEANSFNTACGDGKCDMVAFLLLPDTAQNFLAKKPAFGRIYTSGAQTLFTDAFAKACVQDKGSSCHGFEVWTGYNPPIGGLETKPGVAEYVRDVKAKDSGIDVNNQFVQGAYLGASVFVEALREVGPNLTRDNLQAVLDSMTFESDLSSPLTWKAGNHRANVSAQSFSMAVANNTFQGWSRASGFQKDPNPSAG